MCLSSVPSDVSLLGHIVQEKYSFFAGSISLWNIFICFGRLLLLISLPHSSQLVTLPCLWTFLCSRNSFLSVKFSSHLVHCNRVLWFMIICLSTLLSDVNSLSHVRNSTLFICFFLIGTVTIFTSYRLLFHCASP